MAWPFSYIVRPFMRMAAYWFGRGEQAAQIAERLEAPPNLGRPEIVAAAIPEAQRSLYFADYLRAHPGAHSFGSAWFAAARGAWYRAYGRKPTPEERPWAFTRPQSSLGLMVSVSGRGAWSGEQKTRTITVNAGWNQSWQDVEQRVRELVGSEAIHLLVNTSEPLNPDSISVSLIGGALVERQNPTLTIG